MPYCDVKIEQGKITPMGTKVHLDNKEIHGVRAISYDIDAASTGCVELEIIPERCDIDVLADVGITVDIDSLHTAIKCIQLELQLNDDFREATTDSIRSVLYENGISSDGIAEAILDRIFFGEGT